MARTPDCTCCKGPKRADGSIVRDPLYTQNGVCFDCLLASYLPKAFRNLEWVEAGGAYGEHHETGVPILDEPSGLRISNTTMGSKR
jgi:hypothetical protein